MSNIRSQRKLGLLPKGADQGWAALAAPQLSPGLPTQMRNVFRTKVRQRVTFEVAPDVFGRVEFRGVSWQLCQNNLARRACHVIAHCPAAMHGQTVPDHQQPTRNLPAQVAQKLHRLPAFDATAIEAKVKLPPGAAGDDREFPPSVKGSVLNGP